MGARCSSCGAKNLSGAACCNDCGANMNVTATPSDQSVTGGVYCPTCCLLTIPEDKAVWFTDTERSDIYSNSGEPIGYTEKPVARVKTVTFCTQCGQKYPYPHARSREEYENARMMRVIVWLIFLFAFSLFLWWYGGR